MTARLVFLMTLAFALVALYGWPADAGMWMRALIALAAIMTGLAALALATPSPRSRRFESARGLRSVNRLIDVVLLLTAVAAFYFILVFTPPAASRFSEYVVTFVRMSIGGDGNGTADADPDEPASGDESRNSDYDVGALFDPNGAVIPKSANLNPSTKPVVSLKLPGRAAADKLNQSGQIYLHLFSHHAFDGERWTAPGPAVPRQLTPGPDGLIRLQREGQAVKHRYTVLHHELSTGLDALSTLQGASYVKLPRLTELNPGTWLLPPPDNPLGIIRPYEAGSTPGHFRDMLQGGETVEPGDVGPAYLAPSGDEALNLEIRKLAARFSKHPDLEQQLADVQGWLSGSFGYTLQMDYPDKDQSALLSFLEAPGTAEGFCVHFASAAVLILRQLGVPSRISYGWTGGEYYRSHHQFVFEADDGHAWAEIYLKERGWVVFETTPSFALPASNPAPAEAVPPAAGLPIEDEVNQSPAPDGAPWWTWIAVALATAAALLTALLLKRNKREHGQSGLQTDSIPATPDYLRLFHEACVRMGHPKPGGHTLPHHLRQLQREGVAIPFAEELATYHYQVAYREVERDARLEKRLCRRIKAL